MFSKKLYYEGIRQSFLFGLFLIVMATILNCFAPVNYLIMDKTELFQTEFYNSVMQNPDYSPELQEILIANHQNFPYNNYITVEHANNVMLILMFVIPVIMIFVQFRFLGDRKACDFYHAIPITRLSLAVSYSLSALTWIFLCMIIPMLINGFIYSFAKFLDFDYSLLLPNILEKVIISFLIYSALLIGVSLSSQILTASVIAGLILFLPRFILTISVFAIARNSEYYFSSYYEIAYTFGNNLNLLVSKFTDYFAQQYGTAIAIGYIFTQTNENIEAYSYSVAPYIYTFVLALILFAIGCYTFIKRPSEMAGKNTSNSLTQHIVRIGLITPIVIFQIFLLNMNYLYFPHILPIIIVTLVIYFTYELITTRDLKKLVYSIRFLPVVLVIAIIYQQTLSFGIASAQKPPAINTSDIKNVNIDLNVKGEDITFTNFIYDSYTAKLISEYDITNEKLHQLFNDGIIDYYDYVEKSNVVIRENLYLTGTVSINTNSKTTSKFIGFYEDATEQILDILFADEYINQTLVTTLPQKTEIVSGRATSLTQYNYSYEEIQAIVDVLYQEYNNLTLEEKLQVAYGANHTDGKLFTTSSEKLVESNKLVIDLARQNYATGYYKEQYFFRYENGTTTIPETSSYGSNDFPIALSLYTKDNYSKYIYINDLLPQTKKLMIDLCISNSKISYDIFNYCISGQNQIVFDNFNITSVDDYFNTNTEILREFNETYNYSDFNLVPTQELLDLFATASQRLSSGVDYDNLYIVTFTAKIEATDDSPVAVSFEEKRILLPFTHEEFETYIFKIYDHSAILSTKNNQQIN